MMIDMKKTLAFMLCLLLFASAAMPAASLGAGSVSVTYTGATVDASDKQVGEKFYFTLDVSEYSHLFSGRWLIDYPEEYLTPTAVSSTWSGGVSSHVEQSYEDGNPWSDRPEFATNMSYEGMTGSSPCGEAGNLYTAVGMYLASFDYWGLQMGGSMIRVTYRIDQLPPADKVMHDAGGDYLEIPIIVVESKYYVEGSVIEPGGDYSRPHEDVTVINGKVYISTTEPQNVHTVSFYGFGGALLSTQQVQDGAAAQAPSAEPVITTADGTYLFYGWDAEFDNVTADMQIHAVYVLLGDVDGNGTVSSPDALLALRSTIGMSVLTPMQVLAGDIDRNGSVTSSDALRILRYSMGLINSL